MENSKDSENKLPWSFFGANMLEWELGFAVYLILEILLPLYHPSGGLGQIALGAWLLTTYGSWLFVESKFMLERDMQKFLMLRRLCAERY